MASGSVNLGGKVINQAGADKVGLTAELYVAATWEAAGAATATTTTDSDGLWAFAAQDITKSWIVVVIDGTKKYLIDARNKIQLTELDLITSLNVNTIYEHTAASGVTIDSVLLKDNTITGLTGLAIRSTGAAFDLTFATDTVFTAGRTLTIRPGDAARILTFTADATIGGTTSGTNTGDVTLAGTPDYITIANQVITRAKLDPADDLNTFASSVLATLVTDETGSGALVFGTAPTLAGGTHTALTGLGIRSTGTGAFDMTIANAENLTAGRTLTIQLGDAARILILGASPSLSGTNTGDQTITLTGDVTGSGTGSFVATIANAAVSLAKMANLAQDLFIGRTTASTGVPETATITAAARTVLDDTTVAAMVDTLGGAAATGTGGLARATSPTFVTPALGTPASGVATNLTGTAAGLTAGNVTTNANLTGPITSTGNATAVAAQTGTGTTFVMNTSPTLVTPTLGVASATSLATSAAIPLKMTNGQLVDVAITSQTVGATTLTIPDFAGVVDEFTFKTKAQTMSNKTFVAPALGTPASGVMTNVTGLPTAGLVDGAVTLAKMANLAQDLFIGRTTASTGVPETATITAAARTVLDDTTVAAMVDTLGGAAATGTGGLARATSPTFVTPALGTPVSGVLTNVTGLPTAGLVDDAVSLAKMAAGTAGNLITYDANGDPAAVATGTAAQVLTSNGAGAAPTFQAAGAGTPVAHFSTDYAASGRNSTDNVSGGAVTYGTSGVMVDSSATISSAAQVYTIFSNNVGSSEAGSPTWSMFARLDTRGTDFKTFFGLGAITSSGATINFVINHIGFKITRASSGAISLYATQGDGTAETASAALVTVAGELLDLIFKVNSTTSVDYYYRKAGGALSAAENMTTNMPTALAPRIQIIVSNVGVATQTIAEATGTSYQR